MSAQSGRAAGFGRRGVALSLCLLAAGCGDAVDRADYDAVATGMSEREVIELLGEPERSRSVAVGDLSGSHLAWDGDGFTVAVQLVDGEVVSKQWVASGE